MWFFLALLSASAHADLARCGRDLSFTQGKMDCIAQNGGDASIGHWSLVRADGLKAWWLDNANEVVWGPTHAEPGINIAAFDLKSADTVCDAEGGSLPSLEDFYAAYTWSGAEYALSSSRVLWAKSTGSDWRRVRGF